MNGLDPGKQPMPNKGAAFWPQTSVGWLALALAVVAVVSMFLGPLVTITFRNTFPVVDTWLMPTFAAALIAIATLFGAVAVFRRGERSILSMIVLALMAVCTLVAAFVLIGGALTGN